MVTVTNCTMAAQRYCTTAFKAVHRYSSVWLMTTSMELLRLAKTIGVLWVVDEV